MRSYIWTLLRPRTGALRNRLIPPSLRSCEKIEKARRNRYKRDWESTTCESESRKFLIFSQLLTVTRSTIDRAANPFLDSETHTLQRVVLWLSWRHEYSSGN